MERLHKGETESFAGQILQAARKLPDGQVAQMIERQLGDPGRSEQNLLLILLAEAAQELSRRQPSLPKDVPSEVDSGLSFSPRLKLFFRTPVPDDCPEGVAVEMNQPFLLLEQYLLTPGKAFHPADGFFMFEGWQRGSTENIVKQFKAMHRQVNNRLPKKVSKKVAAHLKKVAAHLRFDYQFDPEGTMRFVSVNFASDISDAATGLGQARTLVQQGDYEQAEQILTGIVVDFPSAPDAAALLVRCWRERRGEDQPPSEEILSAVIVTLAAAVQRHEFGLQALNKYETADPGFGRVAREREAALELFRSALSLAESWRENDEEYQRARTELSRILGCFTVLASSDATEDQRGRVLRELVESPFGQALYEKLAQKLADSEWPLDAALGFVAPHVSSRVYTSVAGLENHVCKTLYKQLHREAEERKRERGVSRSEVRLARKLSRVEWELTEKLGGTPPTEEELCQALGWSKEKLDEVRARSNRRSYEDHMGEQVKRRY